MTHFRIFSTIQFVCFFISVASAEISDGGYAPLPGLQHVAALSILPADEDCYVVLYQYSAQVLITLNRL